MTRPAFLTESIRALLARQDPAARNIPVPEFYVDALDDIPGTRRIERYRSIDVAAPASEIYVWLSQLRVAPYSYDFLDNGSQPSPPFVIRHLSPVRKHDHFLIAFQVHAFEPESFICCRFCEPIVSPFDRSMKRLLMEYRLESCGDTTRLWCKILGFLWPNAFARAFFAFFLGLNKIMMGRQFEVIKQLAEQRLAQQASSDDYHCMSDRLQPDLIWWLFCRRDRCSVRDELVQSLNRPRDQCERRDT